MSTVEGRGLEAAAAPEGGAVGGAGLRDWVRLLRPRQWVKNAFVLAPLLFSGHALEAAAVLPALGALVAFCLLASGVYALNDVVDRRADRSHPVKRDRPVAAGRIGVGVATAAGALLAAVALVLAFAVDRTLGLVGASYVALNVLYSRSLKEIVIVDVFAIASFFVLRLLAGAAAIAVRPSIWLLLCGGLLALYLGFAKRRHEVVLLGEASVRHRSVLAEYTPALLDQISVVLLSVTVVSYVMYTLTSPTAEAVGSQALAYSTVFVLYGVLRYLYLVHRKDGGEPTDTLLTDGALLLNVLIWFAYCAWVVYRPL